MPFCTTLATQTCCNMFLRCLLLLVNRIPCIYIVTKLTWSSLNLGIFFFIAVDILPPNDCMHSQLFLWMQENNKLDASSYSHYMRFMGNKLDAAKMLQLYSSITDESAKSNIYVCNSVLGCLVRKGKFDTSMKLFQQMKGDGLVPDVVTYSTVCDYKS